MLNKTKLIEKRANFMFFFQHFTYQTSMSLAVGLLHFY